MDEPEVLLLVTDGVATITLNRPDRRNATTVEVWRRLGALLVDVAVDPEVRAVVLTGSGDTFCVGADLRDGFPATKEEARARVAQVHLAVARLHNLDKPTVAVVRGAAVGSGLALALCCDFVVAAASARFSYAYSRIGLVGDGGMLFLLQRQLGLQAAKDLAFTSRIVAAPEALALGLAYRVFPDEVLVDAVRDFVGPLAQAPTFAVGLTKRLLHRSWSNLEEFLPEELLTVPLVAATHDAIEGLAAMREKRPPQFRGE